MKWVVSVKIEVGRNYKWNKCVFGEKSWRQFPAVNVVHLHRFLNRAAPMKMGPFAVIGVYSYRVIQK